MSPRRWINTPAVQFCQSYASPPTRTKILRLIHSPRIYRRPPTLIVRFDTVPSRSMPCRLPCMYVCQVLDILSQNPQLPLWVTRDFLPRFLASSASAAESDAAAASELRESTNKMRAEIQGLRWVAIGWVLKSLFWLKFAWCPSHVVPRKGDGPSFVYSEG